MNPFPDRLTISRRHFLQAGAMPILATSAVAGVARSLAAWTADPGTAGSWTKEERLLPAAAVTSGRQHFFGYYDKQPFDPTGQYLLGLQCDVMGRLQEPNDVATIGLIDLHRENQWSQIVETRAWNWQMGCHVEWLPSESRRIIYNDRRDGRLLAEIRDLDKDTTRVLPRPIFALVRTPPGWEPKRF